MKDVTKSHAADFGLPPQEPNESDSNFRHRIAGALRDKGCIVEAHEAQNNCRFDDPEGGAAVTSGLRGAMAMAMANTTYGQHGPSLVGCEMAAGIVVSAPKKPDVSADMLMLLMAMGGR